MPLPCIECRRDFHAVCGDPCCCATSAGNGDNRDTPVSPPEETSGVRSEVSGPEKVPGRVNPDYDTSDPEADWRVSSGNSRRGKRDASLKDQQSTGRKRAAVLFPLDREASCEWAKASPENPKGGGKFPITFGCAELQKARHHGPDKNTLNNEEGNVHRICHFHHNNWHALNDPHYIPGKPVAD